MKATLTALLIFSLLALPGLATAAVRDRNAVYAFRTAHPCPSTGQKHGACRGYVVDHIVSLYCNGPDKPSNMQWQTVADAKAKDRIELKCTPAVKEKK